MMEREELSEEDGGGQQWRWVLGVGSPLETKRNKEKRKEEGNVAVKGEGSIWHTKRIWGFGKLQFSPWRTWVGFSRGFEGLG